MNKNTIEVHEAKYFDLKKHEGKRGKVIIIIDSVK